MQVEKGEEKKKIRSYKNIFWHVEWTMWTLDLWRKFTTIIWETL